jgi:tetraacyldisaccharide 4'-kinase
LEHVESLPGVPVAADPNRRRAIARLLASRHGERVDCVVLDDGFQHRRLARDLDIVLLDAANDPWRDRLLPSGWLREPPGALRRAGAVVITHAERVTNARVEDLDDRVRRERGEGATAVTEHYWTGLRVQPNADSPEHSEPESFLAGKRVFALCAIGSPEGFFEQAHRVGALVVGELALRDHDAFRETTVAGIIRRARTTGAEVVACTAKDWTKLRRVDPTRWPSPVARPTLGLRFVRGEDALRRLVLDAAGPTPNRGARPAVGGRRAPASV